MRKKKRTIYYSDPINDDFASNSIETKKLPKNFKYVRRNPVWLFFEFTIYHFVVRPLIFTWIKLKYHQHFVGRHKLWKFRKKGYFVYANHTGTDIDAFTPSMLTFPKKDFLICNPDATSIPGIRNFVVMLGAIPVYTDIEHARNFRNAVATRIKQKKAIIIYPEAHIWPYYTDIRPFKDTSMAYPYDLNVPCFTMTNVYKKRLFPFVKRPRVVSYVAGPFYADRSLPRNEAKKKLREQIYKEMKHTVDSFPKYEYIHYEYREPEDKSDAI